MRPMPRDSPEARDPPPPESMSSSLPPFIWQGVYSSLSEVPVQGKGYEGPVWSERCRQRFLNLTEDAANSKPSYPSYPVTLLPVVVGMASTAVDESVRILDYGGGVGFGYIAVKNAILPDQKIQFTVKEVPKICRLGQQLFKGDPDIEFTEILDSEPRHIVHLGSSIHYEPDWRETLDRLCGLCQEYLVITDLPAGENPTYATAQTYYDSTLPCWFFNEQEFVSHVEEKNPMRLILRATCGAPVGDQRELPQENFPPEMRVGATLNLIFRRAA